MRLVRFVVGVLLLPVCAAVSLAVFDIVKALQPSPASMPAAPALALAGGFALWLLLYATLPRPVRSYILAHELTHALWASVMGADVLDIRVGRDAGSVTLSRSNFLITLAPYFFPLYTVLCIVLYYVLSIFFDVQRYTNLWLGLVGFTWGFHLTFTIATLLQKQTDIHECGRLFSYTTIYVLNLLGIGLWIVMVSPATLEGFIVLYGDHQVNLVWAAIEGVERLRAAITRARGTL